VNVSEENDKLHEDIRQYLWKLAGIDMLRFELNGDDFIMDDRFLRDFKLAWKNDSDPERVPEAYAREWLKVQQKATTTIVDIGEGDVHIQSTDTSERIYIHTNRGTAEIGRDDLPEIIRVLQGLVAGRTSGGALNAQEVASAAPSQNQLAAREYATNRPSFVSRHEKNEKALRKALGIDY
jgi:hypothetical protein